MVSLGTVPHHTTVPPAPPSGARKPGNTPEKMSMGTSMTMDDMTAALKNKNGKDFDKTFIETMIPHHQGAIDMANLALKQGPPLY
jgi:uncharacterized protein (DUF305 family)